MWYTEELRKYTLEPSGKYRALIYFNPITNPNPIEEVTLEMVPRWFWAANMNELNALASVVNQEMSDYYDWLKETS